MRLVSWNVAGRVRRLDEQAAAVAADTPDLVVAVERCEYRHDWRTDGLSDHSALVADLAIVEA